MHRLLAIILAVSLAGAPASLWAVDASVESGSTHKTEVDKSQSRKKTKEQKDSHGRRSSSTSSTGEDSTQQESSRDSGQASSNNSADVTLPLEAVFLDRIAQMEVEQEPFKTCRLATYPKLARDFGLSAEVQPHVVDTIRAEMLSKIAASNGQVEGVGTESRIRAYRDCMIRYGATIAQAYLFLSGDLDGIKGSVSKGKEGQINVKGLGYDDFITLADAALERAIAYGVVNQTIKRMSDRALNDPTPCRFAGTLEQIQCGSAFLTINAKPQLHINSVPWYGDKFAGYQGTYKVSRGWSLTSSLEKMASTSKYSKVARDIQRYAEHLEAEGRVREATLLKKVAWDRMSSGKTTASVSKLIPVGN